MSASPASLTIEDLLYLGSELVTHLYHRATTDDFPFLDGRERLEACLMVFDDPIAPQVALELVVSVLVGRSEAKDLSPGTVDKFAGILGRFTTWMLRTRSITDVRLLTAREVEGFINRPESGRTALRDSTRSNRLSALRTYFKVLRDLGLFDGDPTADIKVGRNDSIPTRALTDVEIDRCRIMSSRTIDDLRGPFAWALAEATATTSEIPCVVPADIDIDGGRVWLTGGSRNLARWGELTVWGQTRTERLLDAMDLADDEPILYTGTAGEISAQAASCGLIAATIERAGLKRDSAVRPGSVPAWAGRKIFEACGDIVVVTQRLGIRSLDDAARLIGLSIDTDSTPPTHRSSR